MNYTTVKETAQNWGISIRRVNTLCNSGRVIGAQKNGSIWLIPEGAKKPTDKRKLKKFKNINLETFSLEQISHEKSLDKEFKKKNGIYYTPIELVELIFDELNINKESLILDPCSGMGSFIAVALKRGYSNIYGVDNDLATVNVVKETLKFDNVFHYDTINNAGIDTLEMLKIDKPQLIIGNPPYSPQGSFFGNLFVGSLIRSMDMIAKDGLISYIIPKNFLHVATYEELRKTILNKYSIESIIDIKAYFKKVRGEQIILTIRNKEPDVSHTITIKELDSGKLTKEFSIYQKKFENVIRLYKSVEDFRVYEILSDTYESLEDYCEGYIGRGRSKQEGAISGKELRKFGYKNRNVPDEGNKIFIQNIYSAEAGVIGAFAGNLEAQETVTIITNSDKDTCKYLLGIIHSRLCNYYLYNYCYNASRLTMHTDRKYISQIPIVMAEGEKFDKYVELVTKLEKIDYLSDKWHDIFEKMNQLTYDIYGIDTKERKFIEKSVKKIQSARWTKNESR